MTISTAASPLSFAGNGSTTAFAITWAYILKSHVVATLRAADGTETVQVLDTDYTLTDPDATGTLTMTVAPASEETLVITSEPPNTQETDIPLGGSFPASSVEDALDLASQVSQKVESLFDRSLRVPKTDTRSGSQLEIPNETDRASKFLTFDASGDPIVTAVAPTGTAVITPFAETYLDDVNAIATLATLGAPDLDQDNTFSGDNIFGKLTMLAKAINHATIVTVASATSTLIGAAASNNISISGTTQIDGFDDISIGVTRHIVFEDVLQLTHSSTFVLPTSANINTKAGDTCMAQQIATGPQGWRIFYYQTVDGRPLLPATKALQVAGVSAIATVTPSVQGDHFTAAKCLVTMNGTTAAIVGDSLNITSTGDTGVGIAAITWNVDFDTSEGGMVLVTTRDDAEHVYCRTSSNAAGSCNVQNTKEASTANDPTRYYVAAFGKQV